MAFLAKSVGNAMKTSVTAVDNTVKKAASKTAEVLYGQNEPEQKSYPNIYPDYELLYRNKVKLMFKFGGSFNFKTAHWMVLIYEQGVEKCTKCHYTTKGVLVDIDKIRKDTKWKEHEIKTRTYTDIINWCKGYQDANAKYNPIEANCRKFVIRLAEYCNIPTTQINWIISSQYYSTAETIKDTIDGGKTVANGNVIQGVSDIGTSVVKNSAKIVV
eukprot:315799_1